MVIKTQFLVSSSNPKEIIQEKFICTQDYPTFRAEISVSSLNIFVAKLYDVHFSFHLITSGIL